MSDESNGTNGEPNGNVLCPGEHYGKNGKRFDHYAHPAEFVRNRGVCDQCAARIRKHHTKFQHGKTEQPVNLNAPHHVYSADDHISFDITHDQFSRTCDFDFAELEDHLEMIAEQPPDAGNQAAVVLSAIFSWVWDKPSLQTALIKFSALSAGLRDDLVCRDYPTIASELNVTKQAISKAAVNFERAFAIRFSRSHKGRENMRNAQLGHAPSNVKRPATPPAT